MNKNKIDSTIKKWNENYSSDQEGLYKNPIVKFLFDIGHRYIGEQGRSIKGFVLDVGCGMGYHLNFEKISNERKYICLDKDKKMLDKIKKKNVYKIVGSCGKIPLKSDSIDLIIASHILEHLPNLRDDLKELKRVAKHNSTILVVIPTDPGWLWKTSTLFSPSRARLERLGLDYDVVMKHEHVNTFKKCLSEIENQFQILDIKYSPFFIRNYNFNLICCLKLNVNKLP